MHRQKTLQLDLYLKDDLLDTELDLTLSVHNRVGRVEQHLLHVGQTLDLLLNIIVSWVCWLYV